MAVILPNNRKFAHPLLGGELFCSPMDKAYLLYGVQYLGKKMRNINEPQLIREGDFYLGLLHRI